jgi:hypothetical protein
VIRTRAADDFATIRTRLEELRRVIRPRAADDFAIIRARMEELRRERARVLAEAGRPSAIGPGPYHRAASGETQDKGQQRLLPHSIRRKSFG